MPRHPWLVLAALLGWSGLAIQVWLVLLARWQEQASLVGGLINVFGYFTVLTNTLVATVLSYRAFGRASRARGIFLSPMVSSGIATSIVLVAVAYNLLLRHLWQPQGWQWLADALLHDVMPLVFVLYWWLEVPKGSLRLWHLPAWSLYPALYFAFALWRGHEIGVYAYPFIDVASLGYGQVMLNALGVLVGFWGIGLVLLGGDRWRGRRLPGMAQSR
ncbi:Pr6Pr family membrane protein [Pseudomonas guariconensis]|uniref:Pr6Pr family membrane protein n=1 Tax=Pseudomonas TaxID=286 RepID=UPI0020971DAB|nr:MULTISPECIES: Pr6Pr family membrane protein [Pseudomonas]MCO7641723.1 Pr6Pr family membrane protein [Pseudomonas sp. S 311-6]MCO7516632.1 Pr6Pr family membrane protein [Pseudomonas putida]MCO7566902.1 Pr6Pr family membrane protein [Pseudomonas mosselii]MCO7606946.1 Pr6Pr family membrane protein [Pseudomonas guariconensis]MCO7618206.1 Pr6Pr family membrane protein [Pseudomonas guariconensis]